MDLEMWNQEARREQARRDIGWPRRVRRAACRQRHGKALARAFRWRQMLDTGVHVTLEDLARAKGVNATYVSWLRLKAILDGRQLQLDDLLSGLPLEWEAHGPKPAGLYSPVSSVEE